MEGPEGDQALWWHIAKKHPAFSIRAGPPCTTCDDARVAEVRPMPCTLKLEAASCLCVACFDFYHGLQLAAASRAPRRSGHLYRARSEGRRE